MLRICALVALAPLYLGNIALGKERKPACSQPVYKPSDQKNNLGPYWTYEEAENTCALHAKQMGWGDYLIAPRYDRFDSENCPIYYCSYVQ